MSLIDDIPSNCQGKIEFKQHVTMNSPVKKFHRPIVGPAPSTGAVASSYDPHNWYDGIQDPGDQFMLFNTNGHSFERDFIILNVSVGIYLRNSAIGIWGRWL
jgi:hypothetical protein